MFENRRIMLGFVQKAVLSIYSARIQLKMKEINMRLMKRSIILFFPYK